MHPSSPAGALYLPPTPVRSFTPHAWLVASTISVALVAMLVISPDRAVDEGPIIHHVGFPFAFLRTGCCDWAVHWPSLFLDWIVYLLPSSAALTLWYGGVPWRELPRFARRLFVATHAIAVVALLILCGARSADRAFGVSDEATLSLSFLLVL